MLSNEGIKVLLAAYQEFPGQRWLDIIKKTIAVCPGPAICFVPSIDWNIYHRKIPAQHLMYE